MSASRGRPYARSDLMKALFLNPPFLPKYSRQSRSPCVTKSGTLYYPYFLAYATGAAENAGIECRLIDAVPAGMNVENVVDAARSFGPQLIVIDTSTPSIFNDVKVAETLKAALPSCHITLVGTHPTNLAEETLKLSSAVDSVCRGEYDYTTRDLALALETGKSIEDIDGLSFRLGGKLVHNKPRKFIENLDELPFVSKVYKEHLGEGLIRKYFYASITWPYITILTARGCPYNCTFCNSPMKASYRARSVKNVLEELEFIKKEMPYVNEIMFEDETFPAVEPRTIELCRAITESGLKMKWSCNARVNTSLDVIRHMKSAGCRLMCVGFESASQSNLNSVKKATTKKMQLDFMNDVRKAGILVNGCFILGLPDDTPQSMQETIDFAKELNPNTAQFYPIMVYPGTEAFRWAKEKGFLSTEDWSKWVTPEGLHNTTVSRPELKCDELLRWCNKARFEFYTNKNYLFKAAKQALTDPKEAVRILKGGKVLMRHMISSKLSGQTKVKK
jgi:anaerobic magnesium-protoporphyrin IX monomethyl ester cyclase